ncbi:fused DNA-binding response regulator in two-component regulatory system with ZraS: response regulator/sigma54 interaction protein [Escherichia albertii]|uniref:sigma-54-dependent response regulator transcription factor ZraR n=1 Tax=Escherichia albertii TaxID=208962 RepID=UPI0007202A36|nr:sigma-54-dependent response regulator transcription factor ZraR [Escherichia albertii]MCZ8777174.1 sigma-54-dependent response regulator transcription factor ZraR [Escherichia albertii]MCZ9169090.1 sigma-54-dependent response regulator transcription factor ZraR [Escherichia albertii]WDC01795.1 sigma-54-dependent response regulator transcription factor ZraR [Escherichia albertii]BAT37498.1 fused DNA-binding response regulator in two-component regulatory system with ZraS: response regulator/si
MTHDNIDILVVDDDISHCTILQALLRGWGYNVALANSGRQALAQVREQVFDLVLCDVRMAEMDGIATLKEIKALNPAIPVLIMTAYSSVETAVEALKTGALDYLIKPLDFDNLQATLEKALAHTHCVDAEMPAVSASQFGMVGKSAAMQHLLSEIALVAPSEATVLIHGDSGTGKELVARAIHASSARREKPLVALNCAALNESLLESELFGHEKGAFTGADKRREGRFVEADGGTLFLDEIGDISPMMQVRLLRAIQEREVQRVGSNQTIPVDVRLIAATHRDLAEEVNAGRFRQDLYYRLNVVAIEVPSLRQRREDIPLLADHFLQRFAERNRKVVKGFTPQAMDLLIHYDWPGNIRELENAVERAVVLLTGEYISERELPLAIASTPIPLVQSQDIQPLVEVEKEVILAALEKTGGNKTEAARQLGITRKTLLAKLSR